MSALKLLAWNVAVVRSKVWFCEMAVEKSVRWMCKGISAWFIFRKQHFYFAEIAGRNPKRRYRSRAARQVQAVKAGRCQAGSHVGFGLWPDMSRQRSV